MQAILLKAFVSDDAGVGRFAPLHSPRVTGCERVATLSRSPGAVLAEILVPDDAGCPFVDAVSDGAGVGRSAPLHPLGDGVREGCAPLALSQSCSGGDFGSRRCGLSFCGRCFRRRGRGALCSPTSPSGSGGDFGSRRCRLSFCGRCFRRRGRGALCSPTSPSGGGVREGCDPLALSRRVV